jgi:DNA-binding GntR family transcriptional regulator
MEWNNPNYTNHRFVEAQAGLIEVLVSASTNVWLHRIRQTLRDQELRYSRRLPRPVTTGRDIVSEMRDIMMATIARDCSAACDCLAIYMRRSVDALIADMQSSARFPAQGPA